MNDYQKLSDEELVALVRSQDKELYTHILSRYQSKLLRYANYLTGDKAKSSDIVQNTFIKAYINLNSFNTRKKFSSWIYRIAHNEAMNAIKKHQHETPLLEDIDFDSGIDLEDNLIKKELKTRAKNCLKKLSLIYKEPLTLYFLQDKSYEEISDILRLPINTIGTRIRRAKIALKKICQKTQK
jgi:RNA polymerase sigma-70 factor, ECF subfamily